MLGPPLLLLVEDEPLVADLVETFLEDGGFAVALASDGKAAIALLEADPARFSGVITDIRLAGGLDGWAVARRARELLPHVPIIYVSGDSEGDWPSKGVPQSILVSKPFAPAQILMAISSLLNHGDQSA